MRRQQLTEAQIATLFDPHNPEKPVFLTVGRFRWFRALPCPSSARIRIHGPENRKAGPLNRETGHKGSSFHKTRFTFQGFTKQTRCRLLSQLRELLLQP
jgi:hypothetical protein